MLVLFAAKIQLKPNGTDLTAAGRFTDSKSQNVSMSFICAEMPFSCFAMNDLGAEMLFESAAMSDLTPEMESLTAAMAVLCSEMPFQ